jgi:protein SCO1/2
MTRLLAFLVCCAWASVAMASAPVVGVDEHVNTPVPLDTLIVNEDGSKSRLRDLLDPHAPTLLVLAYFRCPLLCDRIVDSLVASVPAARVASGVEYRVLVVSFDEKDTPADAAQKARLVASLSPFERARWHFVIGANGAAARIAGVVGFRYRYDAATDQYAHPAVVIALTPDGRVSRYLYGASFPPEVVATALRDAAGGRAIRSVEQILLTCFQYVPALRQHAAAVAWVLRGGTVAVFASLGCVILLLIRRQHRRRLEAGHA